MEKFIAVGDIHGCIDQLEDILKQSSKFPNHKFVFLGDYIDRGPSSEAVIQRLKHLPQAIFILGNHEYEFLEICKDASTDPVLLEAFLSAKKISKDSLTWLNKSLVPYYETENYIFVHAGINPNIPSSQQRVEDMITEVYPKNTSRSDSKKVIHGHSPTSTIDLITNYINIDTGCGMNGKLSAVVLPENIILSSKTHGKEFDKYKID